MTVLLENHYRWSMKDFNLHEKITELMEFNFVSSKDLANSLGVSVQIVNRWKNNKSNKKIKLSNIIKLCDFFKCSIEFILGRTENLIDYLPQTCPNFYDRLRKIIKEKGKSIYIIDKETAIKDNYFTYWKKGGEPQINVLAELADYLGCTVDYLIGRDK